ncbi:MAG: EutN/CcmL family microcompartment protein [bacterium]
MFIARVTGEVVATIKHAALAARKQLLVVPINPVTREASGASLIALDFVDAGFGDTVLIVDEGSAAALVTGLTNPPIRTMILGVVDEIQIDRGA